MVEVWLPYGDTEVCTRIPTKNYLKIEKFKEEHSIQNSELVIKNCLDNPISGENLNKIIKPGKKVAVVLKNSGKSTNQLIISCIINKLNSLGLHNDDIRIIFAYDPLTDFKYSENYLQENFQNKIDVVSHSMNENKLQKIGNTSHGTTIRINQYFIQSEIKILVGFIEPHPYLNYGGGIECILPGLSSKKTLQEYSSLILKEEKKTKEVNNPIFKDMLEAATLSQIDFSLHLIRNHKQEIIKAYSGNFNQSLMKAIDEYEKIYKFSLEKKPNIMFISPGGYPNDKTFYETAKNVLPILEKAKEGSCIILVAECSNGIGDKNFYKILTEKQDHKNMYKKLKKNFNAYNFLALKLLNNLEKKDIALVSLLPEYFFSKSKIKLLWTANEGVRYAFEKIGQKSKILCIPHKNFIFNT